MSLLLARGSQMKPRTVNRPRRVSRLSELFGHVGDAGWSSPVARQAHNLKVVGSNPAPATIFLNKNSNLKIWVAHQRLRFCYRVAPG